ncbi:MAG: hypothetical protein ACTSRA_00060 [Promethearchaeota archaeon]
MGNYKYDIIKLLTRGCYQCKYFSTYSASENEITLTCLHDDGYFHGDRVCLNFSLEEWDENSLYSHVTKVFMDGLQDL